MVKEVDISLLDSFHFTESKSPFRHYLGYFYDDVVVGYLSFDLIYDRVEIVNFFVKDSFRGRNFGYSLIKYLINFSRDVNVYNITLEVSVKNAVAISLYEKVGFKKVALRKGYYDGIDGILMELIL